MSKKNMENSIKKMSNLLLNPGEETNETFQKIELDKIITEPQPRKLFDEQPLQELAENIALYGVLTPVTVSKLPDGMFILRQGERRFRASKIAGLTSIPAVIDNDFENNLIEKQLIENLQRENLNSQEIADSIKYLVDSKGMKKGEVAKALSKSNAFVSNYYALATFDNPLKELILKKTQDVIIIADFKRLLSNVSDESEKIIEHFLKTTATVNRSDMDFLKNSLEKGILPNTFNSTDFLIDSEKSITEVYATDENTETFAPIKKPSNKKKEESAYSEEEVDTALNDDIIVSDNAVDKTVNLSKTEELLLGRVYKIITNTVSEDIANELIEVIKRDIIHG